MQEKRMYSSYEFFLNLSGRIYSCLSSCVFVLFVLSLSLSLYSRENRSVFCLSRHNFNRLRLKERKIHLIRMWLMLWFWCCSSCEAKRCNGCCLIPLIFFLKEVNWDDTDTVNIECEGLFFMSSSLSLQGTHVILDFLEFFFTGNWYWVCQERYIISDSMAFNGQMEREDQKKTSFRHEKHETTTSTVECKKEYTMVMISQLLSSKHPFASNVS